ncbi:MAG: PLP-dependent aminotransferase family protein, partial [Cyanobacteria bacterium J06636_16]
GMRTGWCAAGRYHSKVSKMKAILNFSTSTALQLTVAAFLSNGGYDRHLRQLRRVYQSQMNRMQQAICDYFPAETCVSRPQGGHVLWLEMPNGFDALRLYREALEHRIGIAPGVMFSASGKCYNNCFRINTSVAWTPAIDQAIQTLGHLAKRQLAERLLQGNSP